MRGISRRVCHGRGRRPLEPYSAIAPLARAVGWGTIFVGALLLLLSAGSYAVGSSGIVIRLGSTGLVLATVGIAVRVMATSMASEPLTLPFKTQEPGL